MPRYRTEFGALVDIPEEKAARMNGLTPVQESPSPTRRTRKTKKPTTTSKTETTEEPTE